MVEEQLQQLEGFRYVQQVELQSSNFFCPEADSS